MTITITAFERSPDGGKGLARDTRVRWALEEVGQPYQVRLVSFRAMKEAGHLALHPFGQIPNDVGMAQDQRLRCCLSAFSNQSQVGNFAACCFFSSISTSSNITFTYNTINSELAFFANKYIICCFSYFHYSWR